ESIAPGHLQVQENGVGLLLFDPGESFVTIARFNHSVAVGLQTTGEAEPDRAVVLGDQDHGAGGRAGAHARSPPAAFTLATWSLCVKTAPPPGRCSARRSPRWARAISRAIARPSPVPSAFVVKKGSNRCARTSAERPGPSSATLAATVSRAGSRR